MKFVARSLQKRGFGVYAPTLAGHCVDEQALINTTWRDLYESLEEGLHTLSKTADRIYVAGICVGGMLGLYLAYHYAKMVSAVTMYSDT